MRQESSESLLEAKEIKKYIKDRYEPFEYKVHIYNDGKIDIYTIVKSEDKGFEIETPLRFLEVDVLEIANMILKSKGIEIEGKGWIIIEHVDGDGREPMDYGSKEFMGVKFRWKNPKQYEGVTNV